MTIFNLEHSSEYYLTLSVQPKRFDADSPVTNVFFDDTNGEVFTVRSGGVTGVTVTGMDETTSTSFRMEDRGPIISIKFSPDHKILAIQRNLDSSSAMVEFVNFKDLAPTNVEYTHSCKWKNAKILGFVWPKANEIAFITDHGIELLQVLPEKKQLKSLKSTSFSGAWYSWCARSEIVLLAGNNGVLLQPFSLSNSSITKLQKLELESAKPVVERDVFLLRLCGAAWCAVFRHCAAAVATSPPASHPAEIWLMPISSSGLAVTQFTHVLKTGLMGRFAVNVVDELLVVHHQSSQTSLLFDITEDSKPENNTVIHIPIVSGTSIKPAFADDQFCPMYSVNWVVFQPDYIVDARLGCLWRIQLIPSGLAHSVPLEDVSKIVAVLLRRNDGKATVYSILNQLVSNAATCLVEIGKVFDEINKVYRGWADEEMARNTAGRGAGGEGQCAGTVLAQADICHHVLQDHSADPHIVQVVTAYMASLSRHSLVIQHPVAELAVRTLVTRGAAGRLRSFVRRGCLGSARTLACQLWSLGNMERAFTQLGLDMMWRLKAYNEVIVFINCEEPVTAIGVARQAGPKVWHAAAPRRFLEPARQHARERGQVGQFVAVYHALRDRNDKLRGSPDFLKGEHCEQHNEYYKQVTSE